MHHYFFKLAIILAVVFCLNRILKVSFFLPFNGTKRTPLCLSGVIEVFETEGWTLIPALILATVWQMAER